MKLYFNSYNVEYMSKFVFEYSFKSICREKKSFAVPNVLKTFSSMQALDILRFFWSSDAVGFLADAVRSDADADADAVN